MNGLVFDESTLKAQFLTLDANGLLVFGLLCCERMIPNYVAFVNQHGWGDASVLRRALDSCWSSAKSGENDAGLQTLKTACENAAPDTEDFDSLSVSSALDAALAIVSLIDLTQSADVEHAVTIASYACDTVDMFVQELENMEPNSPDLEEQIRSHRLMQRELRQQQSDVELVRSEFDIDSLGNEYRGGSSSNIAV